MIEAIIQARMGSSRLPGKAMLDLLGKPVLFHVVERTKAAKGIDRVIVATTIDMADDVIAKWCTENGVNCARGSSEDVLSRYFDAATEFQADTIIRITSDCPLIDPDIISKLIERFSAKKCDYMSNTLPDPRTFPRGLDCEIFTFDALEKANKEAKEKYEREHVTPYIHENKKSEFGIGPMLKAEGMYRRSYRLTLDYQEDYELMKHLYGRFYTKGKLVSVPDVLQYLDEHPEVVAINAFRDAEYPTHGIRK